MIKVIDTIDSQLILNEFNRLEKDIVWLDIPSKKQSGLQYRIGDDMWLSATGKSYSNENSYSELNPLYKGTVFEELIEKYKLIRTRFMWVSPFTCYSMHQDSSPRIHIPIITNQDCYFVFKKNIVQHMPIGSVYQTDTRHFHTFMNCSSEHRLHLVGAITNGSI
jgi:hypothetical protein